MYKILGVITARGGSKGIPRKNIKLLDGKPLIAYTIEVAQKSRLISHLIVSTDDEEIAEVAKKYGADVPFLRPATLAQDKTPSLPVMQHAILFMEDMLGEKFDFVATLQPTSPFRLVEDVEKTIQLLIDTGADSSVTLVEAESGAHPMKMKKLEGDKILPYVMEEPENIRRQDFPVVYKRSGAMYAHRRYIPMEQKRSYGDYVVGHVVPSERSIDIDTEFDWFKAEYMLEKLRGKGYIF